MPKSSNRLNRQVSKADMQMYRHAKAQLHYPALGVMEDANQYQEKSLPPVRLATMKDTKMKRAGRVEAKDTTSGSAGI